MKRIFIVIVILFISFQIKGQENNQLNEIITSSINSYITNDKKMVREGISLMDTSRYYICMDGLPAHFPTDSVKNATFFSLINIEGLPNSFKNKLKKGIKTLFINTHLSKNHLIITVARRGIKRKKGNNVSIAIGDWSIFTYEYSCEKQKWLLIETKNGGV